MFRRHGIARLRTGMMLSALVAMFPATLGAQWWGPYGQPTGAVPRPAAPPAPPSVGEFMSNPVASATTTRGNASRPGVCSERKTVTTTYYVIGPGMMATPAAVVLPATVVGPCRHTEKPGTASPALAQGEALEKADEPSDTQTGQPSQHEGSVTTTVAPQETASGEVLVDDAGMTLYVSGSDQNGESFCYADCARNWPPAAAPVDAKTHGDLAVIARNDGTRQWAFKGRPLYRWAGDKIPGDMKGDGLGSAWAVARTD